MKYFRYAEILSHNTKYDFWIVVNKVVYNLSSLFRERADSWNQNLEDLLRYGGKDISQYFDERSFPILEHPERDENPRVFFTPGLETSRPEGEIDRPPLWTQDSKYKIGRITRVERRVRIMNALANTAYDLIVCDEYTIRDIQQMYKVLYNRLSEGYDWRGFVNDISVKLNMDRTLTENGLFEDGENYAKIFLYFTNELLGV